MKRKGMAMPPWLLVLNFLAVGLLAAGGIRLYAPELTPLNALPANFAWACVGLGLGCLAVFWVFFVRNLSARRGTG